MTIKELILEELEALTSEQESAIEYYNKPNEISFGYGYQAGMRRAVFCIKAILEFATEEGIN